jgi:hypothetical protein
MTEKDMPHKKTSFGKGVLSKSKFLETVENPANVLCGEPRTYPVFLG